MQDVVFCYTTFWAIFSHRSWLLALWTDVCKPFLYYKMKILNTHSPSAYFIHMHLSESSYTRFNKVYKCFTLYRALSSSFMNLAGPYWASTTTILVEVNTAGKCCDETGCCDEVDGPPRFISWRWIYTVVVTGCDHPVDIVVVMEYGLWRHWKEGEPESHLSRSFVL